MSDVLRFIVMMAAALVAMVCISAVIMRAAMDKPVRSEDWIFSVAYIGAIVSGSVYLLTAIGC